MPRPASDDQIIGIGQKFGELKNYLNTSKVKKFFLEKLKRAKDFFKGKAWLEFEEHATAYRAMEAIGNGEVLHMGFQIAVQL